jgi:hypothetical protein
MDQGTSGVTAAPTDGAKPAAAIEREIENIRGKLDSLVAELDFRRHRLSPIRAARKHPTIFAFAGLVLLAGVVGGGVMAHRSRLRKQSSWIERGKRLKHAADLLISGKPIAQPPSIGAKAIAAVASAAGAMVARRLAKRFLSRV